MPGQHRFSVWCWLGVGGVVLGCALLLASDAAARTHTHTHTQLPFGHWLFIVGYNVTFDRPPRRQRMPTCADNGHRTFKKKSAAQPRCSFFFLAVFESIYMSSSSAILFPSRYNAYSLGPYIYRPNGIFKWDSNAFALTNTLKSRMSCVHGTRRENMQTHLFHFFFDMYT